MHENTTNHINFITLLLQFTLHIVAYIDYTVAHICQRHAMKVDTRKKLKLLDENFNFDRQLRG